MPSTPRLLSRPAAPTLPRPAEPACRCVVARGRSPRVEMRFQGAAPVTCRLGASRDSDWWVTGRGVPDYALDLHWDGELLWVADRAGHGRAHVDGEPLGPRWRGLAGGCRLEFPGGALVVDCSRPGVVVEEAPKHAPSVPAPIRSDVREVIRPPAMLGRAEVESLDAMVDEPTRTWQVDPPAATLPGVSPNPNRPRTMLPPPSPAATDDLQDATLEMPRRVPPVHRPTTPPSPGVDNGNGARGRRLTSTGG